MEEGRVEGGGGGLVVTDVDVGQSLCWPVARVKLGLVLVGEGGEAEEGEAGDQVQTPDCAQDGKHHQEKFSLSGHSGINHCGLSV